MIRSQVRILHYARLDDNSGWSNTGTDITELIDFQSNQSTEVSADTFQLMLKNIDSLPEIGPDDRIDFYAGNSSNGLNIGTTSADRSAYFLFNGTVEEIRDDLGVNGQKRLTIQGASATQILLRTLLPSGYFNQKKINVNDVDVDPTVPNIIQSMLEFLNGINIFGRQIIWDPSNPSTKSDGNSFPSVSYATNYKPVYQIIADLSTDSYTSDGDYYFYIYVNSSGSNMLKWGKKDKDESTTSLIEGTNFSTRNIPYGTWDMINMVIVHCGKDAYGNGIMTYYYGTGSKKAKSSGGQRARYVPVGIADAILTQEKQQSGSSGVFIDRAPANYPYRTNYAPKVDDKSIWASIWNDHKFFGQIQFINFIDDGEGNPTTASDLKMIIADKPTFNNFLRLASRLEGKKKGKAIVDEYGAARYKMTCKLYQGRNSDTLGGLYEIESYTKGWTGTGKKKLRLTNIKHTIGIDGWNTSLELEQDWKSILAGDNE